MVSKECVSLAPLMVALLLASSVVCKDQQFHSGPTNIEENKRISMINWRIMRKIYKLLPSLLARPRAGRASPTIQEDGGQGTPPESINVQEQDDLPFVPLPPYLFTSSHLLANDENEAPKAKRNIGRWRNTNWIYSIRHEGPRFNRLYRKK